jgi:hypothetical protein
MKELTKYSEYALKYFQSSIPFFDRMNIWIQCILTGVLSAILLGAGIIFSVLFIQFITSVPVWLTAVMASAIAVFMYSGKYFDYPDLEWRFGSTKPTGVEIKAKPSKRELNRGRR